MKIDMLAPRLRRALVLVTCLQVLVATNLAVADVPLPPNLDDSVILTLGDGSKLIGSYVSYPRADSSGYAQGVWKLKPDGTLDARFNGTGLVALPVWGYYEGVNALAVQRDGRIVVGGFAIDPTDPLNTKGCHPGYCTLYQSIMRLFPDGSLDYTFNGTGKTVLVYDEGTVLDRVDVLDDGRIALYQKGQPIGRVMPDGSIDQTASGPLGIYPLADSQGLWQSADPGRTGWSVAFAQQGEILFATIQYLANGDTPRWLVVPNAARTGGAVYRGTVYETHGPWYGEYPFDSRKVTATAVGEAKIDFSDPARGILDWTVNGSMQSERIVRKVGPNAGCTYGSQRDPVLAENFTDLWWTPSESGWGVHLVHGADRIVATWLTYDRSNKPTWFQGEGTYIYGDYQGDLYWGTSNVGLFNIEATDGNNLDFSYQIYTTSPGQSLGGKAITREVFQAPGTACR